MLVTSKMIWDELQEQKKILNEILKRDIQHSIEEISLYKAAKLLRISSDRIIKEVNRGNIKARIYRDSNRKKRYRFRIADIREFQEVNTKEFIIPDEESTESIEDYAKNFFNNK